MLSNMNEITLEDPIDRPDGPITKLRLTKPKAGQLRGLKVLDLYAMDVNAVCKLLPRITVPALTPTEVADLSSEDLGELSQQVMGFFIKKKVWEQAKGEVLAEIEDAQTVED